MNTDHLRHFDATVRRGSFAAAAREAGLDPSSVSRAVAQLESDLGTRLLVRNTRRMRLTDAGERFHASIAPLLDGLSEAVAALQPGQLSGTIRLTASSTFSQLVLVPLLAEFRQSHPDIRIHLLATDRRVDMVENRIDIALRHGRLEDSTLQCRKVMAVGYRLYTRPGAFGAERPEALADLPHLLFDLPGWRDGWRLSDGARTAEVPARAALMSDNAASLLRACEAGMGVAALADWTARDALAAGRLERLLPGWEVAAPDASLWMLTPTTRHRPARVQALMDHLLSGLASATA